MNPEFNLIAVIRTLLKWKWHIVAVTILSGIIAVLVSLFVLDEYYQSYALLYPTNQSMADRTALFGSEGSSDAENYYYGSKHDANRIITIATSSVLTSYIINHYDLYNHYGYDEGTKYRITKTHEEFEENYSVYKTDKDAVRINFIDTDPELAAEIVNDVVETIEFETSKPIQENKQQLADLFTAKAAEKKNEVEEKRAKYMLVNTTAQNYAILKMEYENAFQEYQEMAKLADEYTIAAEQKMPGVEVIEPAYVAERKLKPVRSVICLGTVVVTFFFACLAALLVEQAKYIKEQL